MYLLATVLVEWQDVIDRVFASKAVNSAVTDQGTYLWWNNIICSSVTALWLLYPYLFSAASYFLFFVNKITPLGKWDKVGLNISQHGEFL
jgi:Amt family ammonium transporter